MDNRRTFYCPPGIVGRPILQDVQPGVRHLARAQGDKLVTFCDLPVPPDHRCPSEAELQGYPVWGVPKNCTPCHLAYLREKERGSDSPVWTG